jgi:membrane protein implicated in regulation of membrane protease activity
MLPTLPWWAWAILGVLLALAELHASGYYLIWIALGAGIAAVLDAALGFSLAAQIVIFIAASAVSCVAGYFVYGRINRRRGEQALNERTRELIGAQGVVAVPIVNGRGKVRLGDTVWLAEGPDLPAGTSVTVTSARGTVLVVAARADARNAG